MIRWVFRTKLRWHRFSSQHRVFLAAQVATSAFACWLWFHLPVPGWAVAALTVAAAAMSIHAEMKGWQKAFWMLLIGFFLSIELRAINKDRKDIQIQAQSDRIAQEKSFQDVRDQQNRDFAVIAKGLSDSYAQSQLHFESTTRKSEVILGQTREAAKNAADGVLNITGGDSFAYVFPSRTTEGNPLVTLNVHNEGDQSLTGVNVTIYFLPDGPLPLFGNFTDIKFLPATSIGSLAPKEGRTLPGGMFVPVVGGDGIGHYLIYINAQTKGVNETLDFKPSASGRGWVWQLTVRRNVTDNHRPDDLYVPEEKAWIRKLKVIPWTQPAPEGSLGPSPTPH